MNAGPRRLFVAVVAVLGMAVVAPSASASTDDIIAPSEPPYTADSGWQAGTCTEEPPRKAPSTARSRREPQFYEPPRGARSGGSPNSSSRATPAPLPPNGPAPIGELRPCRVDLPQGLSVNPQATPRSARWSSSRAAPAPPPPRSAKASITGAAPLTGLTEELPPSAVYNIVPEDGEPARFGFKIGTARSLPAGLRRLGGRLPRGFLHRRAPIPVLGSLPGGLIYKQRLRFKGRSGDGTFITTPTTCFDWENEPARGTIYSTWLLASSVEEEEDPGYEFPEDAEPAIESPLPEGKIPLDCPGVPYTPSTGLAPNTAQTDSPPARRPKSKCRTSSRTNRKKTAVRLQTKEAKVALPVGMGLNPSAGNGLRACTDAQFGKGTRNPVACPPRRRSARSRSRRRRCRRAS